MRFVETRRKRVARYTSVRASPFEAFAGHIRRQHSRHSASLSNENASSLPYEIWWHSEHRLRATATAANVAVARDSHWWRWSVPRLRRA